MQTEVITMKLILKLKKPFNIRPKSAATIQSIDCFIIIDNVLLLRMNLYTLDIEKHTVQTNYKVLMIP